ncbi:hypothetical protein ACVPRA_22450 [Salmonella enterica subsp. enterica serovar Enteritidis]
MKLVRKETLQQQILRLALKGNSKLGLTLNEEFQLEAYKMLLERLEKESEQE